MTEPFLLAEDEGSMNYRASQILDGKIPLVDLDDHKTPIPLFLAASGFVLMGDSVLTSRILMVLVHTIGAFLIVLLGRRMFSLSAGILGAVVYTIATAHPSYDVNYLRHEPFLVVFGLGAVLLYLTAMQRVQSRKIFLIFLSGVFIALSYLSKQPGGIMLPILALHRLLTDSLSWRNLWSWLRFTSVITLGFVAGFAILLFPYGAVGGADELLLGSAGVARSYVDSLSQRMFFHIELIFSGALFFPIIFAVPYLLSLKKRNNIGILLVIWLGIAELSMLVTPTMSAEHVMRILPPLALMGGATLGQVLGFTAKFWPGGRTRLLLIISLMVLLTSLPYLREELDQRVELIRDPKVPQREQVAMYIRERTSPEDPILALRFFSVHYLADRPPPTKFFTFGDINLQRMMTDDIADIANELENVKYVIASLDESIEGTAHRFPHIAPITNYILENYELEAIIGQAVILRHQ